MKPYLLAQKKPLAGLLDRRRKLSEEDKEDTRARHKSGQGIREIAREYAGKCSRRLIQFVIYPQRLKQLQERNREQQHWKKYYNRKQLTTACRNWRNYKYKLFKEKL